VNAQPEIIEVIDDDGDPFGSIPSQTIHDTGGRRWVGPVATAALVAVIAYGVATSASSGKTPQAEPVTSSTLPTPLIRKAVSTLENAPTVPYLAADPPRAFTVRYANIEQLDHAPFTGYGYGLWATTGASATSGSWFSVTTYRGGSTLNAPNAYRVQSGDLTIGISHTAGGQSTAQLVSDVGVGVTITSFGWTDDDLVRLAGSVRTDGRTVDFTDTWFTSDHTLISSIQPWLAVQSIPAEQINYGSSDDPAANVVITAGKRLRPDEVGTTADRQTALRFLLDRNTPFEVDGDSAVAGKIVGQDGRSMVTWITGDNVVTVTASMPLSELIAIARTVHEVGADEWEGMKFQAVKNNTPVRRLFQPEAPFVSSGTDAESQLWAIQAAMTTVDRQKQINWKWDGNGFGSIADDNANINTVVDDRRTYVLADLPRPLGQTAQLQITRAGLDPVLVPFNDADSGADRTFAAYAFSEPTPYTAQIIGADGAVLATWPSS
jgi:hypothetical protein